jgi:GTP-binding protein LepA
MNSENIRNFVIIAHIDAGKSTLADRFLEMTGTVSREKMHPQMLDMMELEQERGITIKLQPVRMEYQGFILNLIDTPGHVDFSYEVSRSLAAVEGAVLVVDATKGIQAQTLANLHHALENNLKIIPVINKIDLPNAETQRVGEEIANLLKIDQNEIIKVSAKTGEGVEKILAKIIQDIPAPKGDEAGDFKALIFDSVYDSFRGVIAYVKVVVGRVKKGDKLKFLATKKTGEAIETGEFKLRYQPKESIAAGEIGYIITGARDLSEVKVGDTICQDSPKEVSPILGFKIPQSMVFASFYLAGGEPSHLRTALEKLKLNDSSLGFTPENSEAFGHGFKCGFLGLLHLEITKVRLEREYNLDLIVTQPQVLYKTHNIGTKIEYEEPWAALEIVTPKEFIGPIMELAQRKRAAYKDTKYFSDMALLEYDAPLSEVIIDFYDKLKSVSQGYASQNYEIIGWRPGDLVKLDCIIAGEKIEEFNRIVPKVQASQEAKNLAIKLKNIIPRQMFEVSIQVAIGGHILAREDIPAMKKDVIAKLYGGDVTRKNKLLKKQTKGKKKMKMLGRVEIPDDVFLKMLSR